jgi:O-antigen/teichoic acid export membrane protein
VSSNNRPKPLAVAILLGVVIAALTAVVAHALGFAVPVAALSGMTAAIVAALVSSRRGRRS